MSHLSNARRRRATALGAAAGMALALGGPAAVAQTETSPWPQHSGDPTNSLQGTAAAATDPGLAWLVQLDEATSELAPEGYRGASDGRDARSRPIIGPDGTLILRARNPELSPADGRHTLIGLDPSDGSLVWELPAIADSCSPALDRQDRLWVGMRSNELAAFDPATGTELPGTRVDPDTRCSAVSLHLGGDDEHVVIFRDISDGDIEAVDISGDEPELAWHIELDEDGPFDDVLNVSGQPRRGLVTEDAVVVPTRSGSDADAVAELVTLSLATGEVELRVPMPAFEGGAAALGAAQLLRSDDTVVVAVESTGEGYLAAFDLSDGLAQQWVVRAEELAGPTQVILGDGVVYANNGGGEVTAYDLADGTTQFDGVEIVELGGFADFTGVADAEGRLLTMTPGTSGASGFDQRELTALAPDGSIDWSVSRLAIRQAGDLVEDNIGGGLRLGPIAADGTVYAFRDDTVIAIDDSGGLATCQLPFDDVDEEANVHAGNICRLVDAGITAGIDDDNYGPALDVTRAQMATFLTRTLGLTPRSGDQFDDVDDADVHAQNIYALVDAGITAGVTDTTFEPQGNLTRAQMATFLARAAELDPVDGSGFDDVDADDVHRENIYAVRDAGITQGVSDSRFAPDDEVRRDQMASFLMRLVDFLDAQG